MCGVLGASPMLTYRLFFLDDRLRVRHSLAIECPDDSEALAWAKAQPRRQITELWQGERVVTRLDPELDA
jgi:hypothetical protein